MKYFSIKHLWRIISILLIVLFAGLSGYFYYTSNLKSANQKNDYEVLNQKYLKASEELKTKTAELEAKNKEIEDLKAAKNQSVQNEVENDTQANLETNTSTNPPPAPVTPSIYNQINGSDVFKNRIIAALDLLKASDNEHYQTVVSQVSTINEYNNYGGYQEKRNIFIGADDNPAITAPIISHEAQHVYNVYVNKIYSYHTKEQELPCYEVELVTAQRVGAPAFFITSIQNNIDYWKTQP